MSGALTDTSILAGTSAAGEAYTIDQSLRFDDGGDPLLTRTPTVVGDRRTWTFSCWVKTSAELPTNSEAFLFSAYDGTGGYQDYIRFNNLEDGLLKWTVASASNAGIEGALIPSARYRDPSAWYHMVFTLDTTNATAGDRMKMYVNGVEETVFDTDTNPSLNYQCENTNTLCTHRVASSAYGTTDGMWDGYIAEVHFIDGTALDASSFGETDGATNQWKPIEYDGTYGTNGFYQKYSATEANDVFADSRVLAADSTFTPTESLSVDVLLVGGGGGGWGSRYSGGGAGGMVTSAGFSVTAQPYPVVVGAGGMPQASGTPFLTDGEDTTFSTLTAYGGGGGRANDGEGRPGGCGGGGTDGYGGGAGSQGGNGGSGSSGASEYGSGGGGGAGGNGGNGTSSLPGDGGVGLQNDYRTGSNIYYAGGGGSGRVNGAGGTGGNGGGGNGGSYAGSTSNATNGTDGLGGGGGGGADGNRQLLGGTGGSGIVVIRYLASEAKATGGTITTYGSGASQYYVHTFLEYDHLVRAHDDVINTRAGQSASVPGTSSFLFGGKSSGDYLMIPPSTEWDVFESGSVFTLECWVKYATAPGGSDYNDYFSQQMSADDGWRFGYDGSTGTGGLWIWMKSGGTTVVDYIGNSSSSYAISDTDWHHVAMTKDGSAFKAYLDGTEVISATDADSAVFTNCAMGLGGFNVTPLAQFDGQMVEARVSDNVRYTAAFTPQTTEFTTDANTLLLCHSNFDGGFGGDSSANKNDYAATNLVVADQMVDSPTNNFATWNSRAYSGGTALAEGNLRAYGSSGTSANEGGTATIGVTSGKWYWEIRIDAVGNACSVGIFPSNNNVRSMADMHQGNPSIYYKQDGNKQVDDSSSSYGNSFTTGDIIGVALNLDDNEIKFYKNNTVQNSGTAISVTATSQFYNPVQAGTNSSRVTANFGSDSTFVGDETAQGNADGNDIGDFYYEPPSGFLALCTSNLSDPSIAKPGAYFNSILYTGNGTNDTSITGVGFQPELAWFKKRSAIGAHTVLDAVRGAGSFLETNNTGAADTTTAAINSFDSDGYTLANYANTNENTKTFVAWNWNSGGTPTVDNSAGAGATPTAGSVKINGSNLGSALAGTIAATRLSADTTNGFSIVKYVGTGSAATIAHGLSVAPELFIIKKLTAGAWPVGSTVMGMNKYMQLNTTAAQATDTGTWNNTSPTASVWSIGADSGTNEDTYSYIAYLFHSVEGYSKVGSYVGNETNNNGPFIYTDFKPAFTLIKSITQERDWWIMDNKRDPSNDDGVQVLWPNDTGAEGDNYTNYEIDYVSNGFKIMGDNNKVNENGQTYLYVAFAQSPFKYSNAR